MASETQYKFFRALYDEENERNGELEGRAKLYITILTFYIGALAFKVEEVEKFLTQFTIPIALAIAAGLSFVLSLAFCIFSVRVKNYEALANPEELIDSFPSGPISDEEFLDNRIADLAVATNRNSRQNDSAANAVTIAGWLLLFGVVLQALIFVVAAFKNLETPNV
jgi:hypothetical protein